MPTPAVRIAAGSCRLSPNRMPEIRLDARRATANAEGIPIATPANTTNKASRSTIHTPTIARSVAELAVKRGGYVVLGVDDCALQPSQVVAPFTGRRVGLLPKGSTLSREHTFQGG